MKNRAVIQLCFRFLGCFFFSVAWVAQAGVSGFCNDESAHIPAGLYHLETTRMDAYCVNPPLPRMLAAVPLLIDRPQIEWHYFESPHARSEYQFAHQWISRNADSMRRQLFLARSMMLVFFAIGLFSIYSWTKQLYGGFAACVAACMWSFSPDILTYSATVAPDLPAASTGLFAGLAYWSWVIQQKRPFPWRVSAAVGLAVLCKFSWLVFFPLLPCITALHDGRQAWLQCRDRRENLEREPNKHWFRDTRRLVLSFCLTLLMINWCYGFSGTMKPLGEHQFISRVLAGPEAPLAGTGNRFADGALASVPVPLPMEMLRGLDYLNWEFEQGKRCYLLGQWKDRGWLHFYLYAIAMKIPVGYWILIAIGFASLFWTWCRGGVVDRLEWLPLLIAAAIFLVVSSKIGFTHHVRYVLPAYGFLFIVASRSVVAVPKVYTPALLLLCLVGTIWFHATHVGLAHTFFNPIAGGPNHGWRHLSHSNVDWGQSTYRMVKWVQDHPEQRPMTVIFRSPLGNPGQLLSDQKGVVVIPMLGGPSDRTSTFPVRPGWYLISSFQMTLEQNKYFWDKTPVAQPDPDILLFQVRDRVRVE